MLSAINCTSPAVMQEEAKAKPTKRCRRSATDSKGWWWPAVVVCLLILFAFTSCEQWKSECTHYSNCKQSVEVSDKRTSDSNGGESVDEHVRMSSRMFVARRLNEIRGESHAIILLQGKRASKRESRAAQLRRALTTNRKVRVRQCVRSIREIRMRKPMGLITPRQRNDNFFLYYE